MPSSRGSSRPRDQTNPCLLCLLHWQVGSLPLVPPGKHPVEPVGAQVSPNIPCLLVDGINKQLQACGCFTMEYRVVFRKAMELSVKCPIDQIIALNLHIAETVFSNCLEGNFSSNAVLVGKFRHRPLIRPMYVVRVLVTQSCPTLCHPMSYSPPGSSVHLILKARMLE